MGVIHGKWMVDNLMGVYVNKILTSMGLLKPKQEIIVTIIRVYDGKYFTQMGRMDNVTIVVKGQVQPHHIANIQSSIIAMYSVRYTIRRFVPDKEVIKMLERFGYEILTRSVVYNMDYTGTDSIGDER